MNLLRVLFIMAAPIFLAGCGAATDFMATMRNDRIDLTDGPDFDQAAETSVVQDAIALEERIRDIMSAAYDGQNQGRCTARGLGDPAMIGCDEKALKGHWIGRLSDTGPIDADAVTPRITAAQYQMDTVAAGLRAMLDAQNRERVALRDEATTDAGFVSLRLTEMAEARAAIADALSLAAQRSAKTVRQLQAARDEGQPELAMSLNAVRQIEDRAKTLSDALRAS